ncbi:DegV family protein [Lysinibacillus sp. FSL M8-0216]|uniref:DegV family protein n=1 Tax=Lysinibacillus TaxID=400634 RepID=UPI00088FEC35|nr:DegV family protein [Lysinibacillus fusiformis]MED4077666.1 DegV family protein [Lysinibacillus fusiformis]SCX67346.1 EDD domain protein, DegV family [Lysinibacillus fusiformis]SDB53365.1 EDD domain protein, DegV family [Lysinibacillus fusiformis]SFI97143.1 EDD domain protein, DegV family [Lysinibacillus fusiformis]SFT25261.1 EDD domain protein, DegV family [Lysinibacillus fusiformis]
MKIFTDSGCDLPKSYYEENDVVLLPLRVQLNNKEYEDVISIDSKEVYDGIRQGAQPKTSQVSPELFLKHFEDLAKNEEEGIYIAFSSELSGTYSTAQMIRNQVLEQYPSLKLVIIDSKCASLGHGLVVEEAVRLRNLGTPFEDVASRISAFAPQIEHLFTVEDLDYLAKGGRVSKASAFLGGLLSIKPILNVEDGKLVPIEKSRGRKKALNRMLDLMQERGGNFTNKIVGISHSDDMAFANEAKASIQERFSPQAVQITMIGSAIGSHVGPGTIAIFFTNKSYEG